MKNFLWGFIVYFRGLSFAWKNKAIRRTIFISNTINIIIFGVVFVAVTRKLDVFLKAHLIEPHIWYQHLYYYAAYVLSFFSIFFISILIVYIISRVLMVGWGDFLSRQSLTHKNVLNDVPKRGFLTTVRKIPSTLLKALGLLFFSTMGILIALIPGLGLLGFFISSTAMAFDMMDYGFDHYHLTLRERFSFFKDHLSASLGFSLSLGIVMSLPVINVLLLPSSIVAASYWLAEIKVKNERSHS